MSDGSHDDVETRFGKTPDRHVTLVLVVHLLACAAILFVISPPFVHTVDTGTVSPVRILTVSALWTAALFAFRDTVTPLVSTGLRFARSMYGS